MKKKLFIVVIVLVVLSIMYGIDYTISRSYELTLVEPQTLSGVADGKTPIEFTVKASRKNKPLEGHTLYIMSLDGGSFSSNRVVTDKSGCATFKYYPFLESTYLKSGDVLIQVSDESNSIFISVPAKTILNMRLSSPNGNLDSKFTTQDIFGD